MDNDPFDDLLGLEDSYYTEGFKLGEEDGKRDGSIQGRSLGLEKGFEKFLQTGRLHGRCAVWNSRLPVSTALQNEPEHREADEKHPIFMPVLRNQVYVDSGETGIVQPLHLSPLASNARLEKHVRILFGLTEPDSLSTQNNEEEVSDFDDRYKRAVSKAMIIGKLLGEDAGIVTSTNMGAVTDGQRSQTPNEPGIEDVNILQARH